MAIVLAAIAWTSLAFGCLGGTFISLPRTTTNAMSLRVHSGDSSDGLVPAGTFELTAFGRTLLSDLPAWHRTNVSGQIKFLESASSNHWDYVRLDLTPAAGPDYARWLRHLLFVAPDLFAILDEAELAEAGQPRIALASPGSLMLEPRSKDFRLETRDAGFTAHVFASLPAQFDSWKSNSVAGSNTFTWKATNQVQQIRILTLIIPHAVGKRGGTGFKLMESDTAVGARVWRNGLPTLIAFRTAPPGSGADLASMPFDGPVAVDVFDPEAIKRRRSLSLPKRSNP